MIPVAACDGIVSPPALSLLLSPVPSIVGISSLENRTVSPQRMRTYSALVKDRMPVRCIVTAPGMYRGSVLKG